ncbi:MAG: carboxypeptidase-like regulatory domain-containing protein, partial [bacterium]
MKRLLRPPLYMALFVGLYVGCGGGGGTPQASGGAISIQIADIGPAGTALFNTLLPDFDALRVIISGNKGPTPFNLSTDYPPTSRSISFALPFGGAFTITAQVVQRISGNIIYSGASQVQLIPGDNTATVYLDPKFTVVGRVLDIPGAPLSGAIVTTGGSSNALTTLTGPNGYFFFYDVSLVGDHVFDARSPNYETGHKPSTLIIGANNVGDIHLGTAPVPAFAPAITITEISQPDFNTGHLCT